MSSVDIKGLLTTAAASPSGEPGYQLTETNGVQAIFGRTEKE
jgi:hypothetical protein